MGDTPKPMQGTWTLTAPDGRTWQADAPLQRIQEAAAERSLFERAAEALAAYMAALRTDWTDDRESVMARIRAAEKLAQPVYAELYAIVNPDDAVTLGGGFPGDPNGIRAAERPLCWRDVLTAPLPPVGTHLVLLVRWEDGEGISMGEVRDSQTGQYIEDWMSDKGGTVGFIPVDEMLRRIPGEGNASPANGVMVDAIDYVEWKRRYAARLMHHGRNERAAIKEAEYVWASWEDTENVPRPEEAADQDVADGQEGPGGVPGTDGGKSNG